MEKIGHMIWRTEGRKPGPHLMILGGVHGNELTGIRAVRWLKERFGAGGEKLTRGTLTLALGNPQAIRRNTRGSAPGLDLNRSFLPQLLAASSNYEEARAAALAPLIAGADVLVDLHAANTPSKPFIVATDHDDARAELAEAFPCRTYVIASDEVIPGSTDGWIGRHGGRGLGYESGLMTDLARLGEVKVGVEGVLRKLGLVRGRAAARERQDEIIRLEEPLIQDGASFAFAEGKGRRCFEPVRRGEILGHVDGRPVRAPMNGLLVFPKPKQLRRLGAPIGFLARRGS